jgi:hypothetical protein
MVIRGTSTQFFKSDQAQLFLGKGFTSPCASSNTTAAFEVGFGWVNSLDHAIALALLANRRLVMEASQGAAA